jgi:phosphotransferase system enzyme I (PtsP)
MQYMFAADRDNPRISHRYDPLSPAFLRALKSIVDRCDAAGKPVSVCGEMAGRPLEAMALLGLGFRQLSTAAAAIGPLQMLVRSLDIGAVAAFLAAHLARAEPSLRDPLRSFALDHGAELGDGLGSR